MFNYNSFLDFIDRLLGYWIERGSTVIYQLPPDCVICKLIGGYDNIPEDILSLIRVYLHGKSILRAHYSLTSILIGIFWGLSL